MTHSNGTNKWSGVDLCLEMGLPGSVPFVSDRPGAYGRLLLSVYVRWKTGVLVPSDWLRSVTRGSWRTVFPERVRGSVDVSGLYKGALAVRWSFGGWMLNLLVIPENWRWDFDFQDCDSLFGRVCEHLRSCCAFLRLDKRALCLPWDIVRRFGLIEPMDRFRWICDPSAW